MIIRTPTRTKTKSFKGEQMDFKFPSNDSSEFKTHDEVELNNHFLVNESLKNENNQMTQEKDSTIPSTSNITSQSYYSKRKSLNANLSNGYYSFANISDNTTSPSFFHDKRDSETESDSISMLNTKSNTFFSKFEYPQTLAPKRNIRDFSLVESHITSISSPSPTPQHQSSSPQMENSSIKSSKTTDTTQTDIPTADNLSYDIISSSSLSCLNSSKLDSLRLPSSSSSSNVSSKGSLYRRFSTVKRTPMNLYRKPTIRKVDSMENSSVYSDFNGSENSNKNKFYQNNSHYGNSKSKSQSSIKKIANNNKSNTNNSNSKTVRRMNSMRAHPRSTLKRSKAIRCHGGLLKYFEMIGVKIKKLLKHIRLLFFKKRTVNNYQSKTFNSRRSCSSFSSINSCPNTLTANIRNKKLRDNNKNNTIKKINEEKQHKYHVPNSSSLQALQPALIEKVKPTTVNENQPLAVSTENKNPNTVEIGKTNNDINIDANIKAPADSTINSPVMNNVDSIMTTNNNNSISVSPFIKNGDSTRTNSTLRRTNSSIRRAASILTASTPSTSTYYSTITHQENGSPVRKSRLIRSVASTSLNSLVRQPSIVVKNKVIPLSMCGQYSMNEIMDCDMKHVIENEISNRFGSPLVENNIHDTFDTIKEEEEEEEKRPLSSAIVDSDSDSSIFTKLGITIENTTESNENGIEPSLETRNEKKEQTRTTTTTTVVAMENEMEDDIDNINKEEKIKQIMKTYLSQIIKRRILMRLQMIKFQESNIMEPEYKQMIDELVNNYETENRENSIIMSNSENEDESDTSSSITSSEEDNDSLVKFSQFNTTTDVDEGQYDDDIDEKNSPMSLQYQSKDVLFGMNTLLGPNREKVLSIPTSTIKRSMTLPIGMKI